MLFAHVLKIRPLRTDLVKRFPKELRLLFNAGGFVKPDAHVSFAACSLLCQHLASREACAGGCQTFAALHRCFYVKRGGCENPTLTTLSEIYIHLYVIDIYSYL